MVVGAVGAEGTVVVIELQGQLDDDKAEEPIAFMA
jgi:hypothetical protein